MQEADEEYRICKYQKRRKRRKKKNIFKPAVFLQYQIGRRSLIQTAIF